MLSAFVSLAIIAGLVIWLDQLTKDWVRSNLALGETWRPFSWLPEYVRIVHWRNSGAAFSLGSDYTFVFPLITCGVIAWIAWMALVTVHSPSKRWTSNCSSSKN